MSRKEKLLERLNQIGESLKKSNKALALIGLGSVGVELSRLDDYSDIDFFAIVKDGYKNDFIENLNWLSDIKPIAYNFKNSKDGHKVMFDDGIYCEFAVFEAKELESANYSEGRIVWKTEDFPENLRFPKNSGASNWKPESVEWVLGEIITCIYVGLCRYKRNEKLSGLIFVEGHAFNLFLELLYMTEQGDNKVFKDIYSKERRIENRFPWLSEYMSKFLQGYDKTKESARELINYLDEKYKVNKFMKETILKLCE